LAGRVPEIEFAGIGLWTRRNPQRLGNHRHEKSWEICYLARGLMDWSVEGEPSRLGAGDLFITRPNESHHGVDSIIHRCEVCYLALALPPTANLPGLSREQNGVLADGFSNIRSHSFRADPLIAPAFSTLLAEGSRQDPLHLIIARAALHEILAGTLRSYQTYLQSRVRADNPSPQIQAAQQILKKHLTQPISVAGLAARLRLSRSFLHNKFVSELGMSPAEYLTRLRIDHSKELLKDDIGNLKIAELLHFASPQHFSTAFKRTTGLTPRAWRSQQDGAG
jgi:AraC-like DNA-binding protein